MRKIKSVLRLKLDAKLSHQQIAAALEISKGVVTKYVGLAAAAAGLDWATVQGADEAALERQLLVAPERPRDHVRPDYGRLHQELRRKGMTLMPLWEEHRADYAEVHTYSYSQFCENYRHFAKQLKRSMRQVHRAGEKPFIDYAGPTIELTDGSRAHIFVAALGASSYTYACACACATPRETMADWIESTARALAFIGGERGSTNPPLSPKWEGHQNHSGEAATQIEQWPELGERLSFLLRQPVRQRQHLVKHSAAHNFDNRRFMAEASRRRSNVNDCYRCIVASRGSKVEGPLWSGSRLSFRTVYVSLSYYS